MKIFTLISLILILQSCSKNKVDEIHSSKNDTKLTYIDKKYTDFSNKVLIDVSPELDNVLRKIRDPYYNYIFTCMNQNGYCDRKYNLSNGLFYLISNSEKKLIIFSKSEVANNCTDCIKASYTPVVTIQKIEINKIERIDTIKNSGIAPVHNIMQDRSSQKNNISIIFYPKYNAKSIESITVYATYDTKDYKLKYDVDSVKTNDPIYFSLPNDSGYAMDVFNNLQKLKNIIK